MVSILPLTADQFHNINGFYGERAAGLAGAFTALSDDPSGSYYNPAGLAFAYDNYISLSASNYSITKKTYENALGPGQNYSRDSQNYIPNFFGIVKKVDSFKIGFSIINEINDAYDRTDQINSPVYYPNLTNMRNYNMEDYKRMLVGLSGAYSLSDKLSIGATVFYMDDRSRQTSSFLTQFKNGTYSSLTSNDRRKTVGFVPVLGIQYMPNTRYSLGASIRRIFVTGQSRLASSFNTGSSVDSSSSITIMEGTEKGTGLLQGTTLYRGAPQPGSVPEVTELRLGGAYIHNKYFLVSMDIIHTSGYKKETDQNSGFVGAKNGLILNGREIRELSRTPTNNFALGAEYYLTDTLAVRGGSFTNYANTQEVSWGMSALNARIREIGANSVTIRDTGTQSVIYNVPKYDSRVRNEYINTLGYTLGFSWSSSKASISFTYIREKGIGQAQIDDTRPNQVATYNNQAFYLVVSAKSQ